MAIITSGELTDLYNQRTFRANGSTVTLKKISDTDWALFGDLAEGDSEGFPDAVPAVEFPGVVTAHDPYGEILDYIMPSPGSGYTVAALPNGDFMLDITPGSLEFKWVGIKFEESSNEVSILVESAEPWWNMSLTANRDSDWVYNPALVGEDGETTSLSNIYDVNVGGLWNGGNILIRPTNSEEYIQRLAITVRIIPAM